MRPSPIPFLFGCAVFAQQPEPAPPAPVSCERLVQEFEAARTAHNKAVAEAHKTDAAAVKQLQAKAPTPGFVKRFQARADELAGTPAAVPFLVWIVGHAPSDTGAAAATTVMEQHLLDPGIRLAVARLGTLAATEQITGDRAREWLDAVIAKNPDVDVQAQARYTRASMHVGTRATKRSEELRQQSIADLETVIASTRQPSLAGLAKSLLYEAKTLEPGLPAPEIEGEDLDGVRFKLSDYRGKVVLLDYWGDW